MNCLIRTTLHFVLVAFLSVGCFPQGQSGTGGSPLLPARQTEGEATLSLFLQAGEGGGPPVWVRIDDFAIKGGERWFPLALGRNELRSRELDQAGQLFLGRGGVPPGDYDRLRITLDKAALERGSEKLMLSLAEQAVEISLSEPLSIAKGDSLCLFLTWHFRSSLKGKATLAPVLDVEVQSIPLSTDLVYVTCPEIDTVYIVRTDQNQVCGSVGVHGGPTCIEVRSDLNRFYVLSSDDPSVGVFELTANRHLDRVRIPFGRDIPYMAVGPQGRWAYILERDANRLLRLDLFNGALVGRMSLGARPQYITYPKGRDLLAVSSAYGHEVSLIDPESLRTVQKITTGGSPAGLLIREGKLYIAEHSTGTVIDYDLTSNQVRSRIKVGMGPSRLIENNDHIYVSNREGRSISVLLPGQLNASGNIRLEGEPFEMAVSSPRQWLYAGDSEKGGIYLVDLSSNQMVRKIELGSRPYDLSIIER